MKAAVDSEASAGKAVGAVGIDREVLTEHLLKVVSDRTGYPSNMIDLDADLDADLGIDSIKWVEILGTLQESCLKLEPEAARSAMEALTQINTLRGIIDWIDGFGGGVVGKGWVDFARTSIKMKPKIGEAMTFSGANGLGRFLLKAVPSPLGPIETPAIPRDGVILITDDEQGIGEALAGRLTRFGGRVTIIQEGAKAKKKSFRNVYKADLTDFSSVKKMVELIRSREGAIRGIIHLLPLKETKDFGEIDSGIWRTRLATNVKGLFYLMKASSNDLKNLSSDGKAWFLAATSMGGTFGSDGVLSEFFCPSHGGVAGLVKSVAAEWPTVHCKVIDLDREQSPEILADFLVAEMSAENNAVEVGYRKTERVVLTPTPAPLNYGSPELSIASDWVILATGGARGITAEVSKKLALRYKPTIILAGRSPLPPEEPPETAAHESAEALKKALIDQMRGSHQNLTPRQVETVLSETLRDREMRKNFAAMVDAGATVHYHQVNVLDEKAFGAFIRHIYNTYGRLDGVIHGAGVIEDKRIEDKTPGSFDRVFDTKAHSAFVLSRSLRSNLLKFLVFFSSVSGRFGNRGQSDYAAANEVLNKMAAYLDRRWTGRMVSVNWNPWAEVGMASASIRKRFSQSGIEIIMPQDGCCGMDEELRFGTKGDVEVLLGDGVWTMADGLKHLSAPKAFPLLDGIPFRSHNGQAFETSVSLDPARHLYHQHHRLDGKPVLPFAVSMELMSEVVQRAWPDWVVTGVRSVRRFRGIAFENSPRDIRVVARLRTSASPQNGALEVDVEINDPNDNGPPYYRGVVELDTVFPGRPSYDAALLSELGPFPLSTEEAYNQWLFHGPCMRGISKIEGVNDRGICAVLLPSSPAECVHQHVVGGWMLDPVVVDSAFQLSILWERVYYDMTPLISSVKAYRRFDVPPSLPLRCWAETRPKSGGHILFTSFFFVDDENKIVSIIEDMEASCSKSLNRLAGRFDERSIQESGDRGPRK